MIKNEDMAYTAKVRTISAKMDIDSAAVVFEAVVCREAEIRVRRVTSYYIVATNDGTLAETITVGVRGALTRYATATALVSTAEGTVQEETLTNATTFVPKGEPLIVKRSANGGAQTNTGILQVIVEYEIMDGPEQTRV